MSAQKQDDDKTLQAKWVYCSYCGGFYKCSRCGHDEALKLRMCPECGASMEGGRYDQK